MITAQGIVVRFNGIEAVRLSSLEIGRGERVGLRGPNGCGKSTLMRVLAGLLEPTEGTVEGLPETGRVVLVHQRPYFYRGTARENVAFASRLVRQRKPGALVVDDWLAVVGASHLADRPAKVLSGGEARRVAIARALAAEPEVLLLDEPFAALDDEGADALRDALEAFTGTLVITAPHLADAPVSRIVDIA